MAQTLANVTVVVREYDEAIAWFTCVLGLALLEDRPLGNGKRWVRVAPVGQGGTALLLARAATPEQAAYVGNQTGGRVAFFLHTTDFWTDYRLLRERGVQFGEEPREEEYGTMAVFADLYGNRWDLIEPKLVTASRKESQMNTDLIREAAQGSLSGTMAFPDVVAQLLTAGVDYFHVDYAGLRTTHYGAGGEAVVLPIPFEGLPPIAAEFSAAALRAAILDSQRHGQKYRDFSRRAMAAGVQGYFAFLRGQRVTYWGRTGDQHTEWFPGAGPKAT